ncbi:MAG TPA: hypothetical protein VNU25_01080 [Candidatus Paceibacterota bacterium]|nr:hypothetical protein [Candidatus Paceibacterota bacterium]
MNNGTPSEDEVTGNYIQFQSEVLRQLPRPDDLDRHLRLRWMADRAGLHDALHAALCVTDKEGLLRDCGVTTFLEASKPFDLGEEKKRWRLVGFDTFIDAPLPSIERRCGNLLRSETVRQCTPVEAFMALRPREGCHLADVFEVLERQSFGGSGVLSSALSRMNYFFVNNGHEAYFVGITRHQQAHQRFWGIRKIPIGSVSHLIQGGRPIFTR